MKHRPEVSQLFADVRTWQLLPTNSTMETHTHTRDAKSEAEEGEDLLRLTPERELMLLDTAKTKLCASSPLR